MVVGRALKVNDAKNAPCISRDIPGQEIMMDHPNRMKGFAMIPDDLPISISKYTKGKQDECDAYSSCELKPVSFQEQSTKCPLSPPSAKIIAAQY